jgi:hypothetical protein
LATASLFVAGFGDYAHTLPELFFEPSGLFVVSIRCICNVSFVDDVITTKDWKGLDLPRTGRGNSSTLAITKKPVL